MTLSEIFDIDILHVAHVFEAYLEEFACFVQCLGNFDVEFVTVGLDVDVTRKQFDDDAHTAKEVDHPSLSCSTTTKRAHSSLPRSTEVVVSAKHYKTRRRLLKRSRTYRTRNDGIINGSSGELITPETEASPQSLLPTFKNYVKKRDISLTCSRANSAQPKLH